MSREFEEMIESTESMVEKMAESVGPVMEESARAAVKGFSMIADAIHRELGMTDEEPLQQCWEFAAEKGFEIKFEPKWRGYRFKLRFWQWLIIPFSMWGELRKGGHSVRDVFSITAELQNHF